MARLRSADDALCVICTDELADPPLPLVLPAPLAVPPLARRAAELDRIIAEYAGAAIAELAAPPSAIELHGRRSCVGEGSGRGICTNEPDPPCS